MAARPKVADRKGTESVERLIPLLSISNVITTKQVRVERGMKRSESESGVRKENLIDFMDMGLLSRDSGCHRRQHAQE